MFIDSIIKEKKRCSIKMFECRGHLLIATRRASPEKKDVEKITRRLLTTPFPLS